MRGSSSTPTPTRIAFSDKRFLVYFIAIICMFFGFLLLAMAKYPPPYSIQANSVSNLGRADQNPNGWYFFTIALWSTAIGLIPFYFVLFKLFKTENKLLAGIMIVLYFLTSAGLCMAGTFQEGSSFNRLHLFSAYFGFGGFFLAGIFTWILMGMYFRKIEQKERKVLILAFIIEIGIMCTGATLFIADLVLHEMGIIDFDGSPFGFYIGFPFTEWMLVITIFIDKVFMGTIVTRFMNYQKNKL